MPAIASFGDWRPPRGQAHYLACPQNYCLEPDLVTALKPIAAERLRTIARTALDAQPQAILVESGNEGLRLVYRFAGGWFGSDDTATIEIIDADEGLSGIAVYCEAELHGSRDNERDRVRNVLAVIDAALVTKMR